MTLAFICLCRIYRTFTLDGILLNFDFYLVPSIHYPFQLENIHFLINILSFHHSPNIWHGYLLPFPIYYKLLWWMNMPLLVYPHDMLCREYLYI